MSDATAEGESVEANIEFTVIYRKDKLPQRLSSNITVGELKKLLQPTINLPINHQKIIHKGILTDDTLLSDLKLTKASKLMVIGASQNETESLLKLEADMKSGKTIDKVDKLIASKITDLAENREHQAVLERHGKPDNLMVGISNKQDPLPPDMCLTGMYDKRGQKIRVRINLDHSELILATKDRTQKIPLKNVQEFVNYPLPNHNGYELVGFQLGSTEKSRVFVYWFPSQYVESMRDIFMQFKLFSNNDDKLS